VQAGGPLEQLSACKRLFGTAFSAQAPFLEQQVVHRAFLQFYGVNIRFVDSPPSFFKRRHRREYFWVFEKGNLI